MSCSKFSDARRVPVSGLCERCSEFVGKLKPGVRMPDLETLFGHCGRIVDVRLQLTRIYLKPFAYVTYEKERHAQDAVRRLDGHEFQGGCIRVQKYRRASSGGFQSLPPMTPYTLSISGLPKSATWTDLKTHFQVIGPVGYSHTFGDGTGVVEFLSPTTMQRALMALDGSMFRSFKGEKSYITLSEFEERKSRSRSIDRGRHHRYEDSSRSRSRHGRGRRSRSPPASSGSRSKSRRGREAEKMEVKAKVSKMSSNSTCDSERERHRRRNHRERSRSNSALRWSRSK